MKKTLLSVLTALAGVSAGAQTLIGLTSDDRVFQIPNPTLPTVTTSPVTVTGLSTGQTIVGMDFRPATGELYILGFRSSDSTGRLYRLNYSTGVATPLDSSLKLALGTGPVGFDFNPAADRIRVVSSNRRNYRLNPNNGTLAVTDPLVTYSTANGQPFTGLTPHIVAAAYTNSYLGTSATTLLVYDDSLNSIAVQNATTGTLTTLNTASPASGVVQSQTNRTLDMDIYFDPSSKRNTGYLVSNGAGTPNDTLYTLNLTTGKVTNVGAIGLLGTDVKNIAAVITRTVSPTVVGQLVFGITTATSFPPAYNLFTIATGNPEEIRSYKAITGLNGRALVGIDFRPANGRLYGLTYNPQNRQAFLYTIDTATAAATVLDTNGVFLNLGGFTGFSIPNIGFDFNPVADRIRVVSSTNDSSFRLNPNTGALAATDTAITFSTGDVNAGRNPSVGAVAYTNSFKNPTATVLYGFDDSLGALLRITPPNRGTATTVGTIVPNSNLNDRTSDIDFYYDSTNRTDIGYLNISTDSSLNDVLYSFNTNGGAITRIDTIGYGMRVEDIAVVPSTYMMAPSTLVAGPNAPRFALYPNPVGNELFIELPATTGRVNVRIVTPAGMVVSESMHDGSRRIELPVGALAPGVYFVSVPGHAPAAFVKR